VVVVCLSSGDEKRLIKEDTTGHIFELVLLKLKVWTKAVLSEAMEMIKVINQSVMM
jgi:hypothetical protein